jgi:sugar/nucleoside kinase (ribokinase family)
MGDMTVDIFAQAIPALPNPGEALLTPRIAVLPGGNALNTAVALQRLGEPASFHGWVGNDAFGDLLLGELTRLGLDLRGVRKCDGRPTAVTLIFRAEHEDRRFVYALGAGEDFTGEDVAPELVPDGGVVLAAGFLKLRSWRAANLAGLFQRARARGCTTVLNVCIPREGGLAPESCLSLLPWVDVFVPNEDEARILTGRETPDGQALALRKAGARLVVITRGARGLYAMNASQTVEMGAFKVPLVDPTGCGDCFTAGLIAGLLRGWDIPRLLTFASAVGALAATALGSTNGVPPIETVEKFLLNANRA